jgi:hypothetical protein
VGGEERVGENKGNWADIRDVLGVGWEGMGRKGGEEQEQRAEMTEVIFTYS